MSLRPFAYDRPATIADTIALLSREDRVSRPLAGGTDLLTLMKGDIEAPDHLIDIKRLADLRAGIARTEQGIEIGALATLAEVETNGAILEVAAVLAQAAGLSATPQLRHMATIGGNLLQRPRCWYFREAEIPCWRKGGDGCPAREGENQLHAIFDDGLCVAPDPSDPANALLALDAEMVVRSPAGERIIPAHVFFRTPNNRRREVTRLRQEELLISIRIPTLPTGTRSTYLKAMDRHAWSFALVSVAGALAVTDGVISHARVVLGGVATIPHRSAAAEAALLGSPATDDTFAQAAAAALADATPLEHNGYKVPLAAALIRRALAGCVAPSA